MTQFQFLADWIEDAIIIAFVCAILFPAIGFIYRWWDSSFGWNMIVFDFAVGLALFPAFLHRVFNVNATSYAFLYIEALSITAVPVIVLWRVWAIYGIQRAGAVARKGEATRKASIEEEETGYDSTPT